MTTAEKIAEIETGLALNGLSVADLCERAGVNRSTWTRWKSGSSAPITSTFDRVLSAYDDMTKASAA